MWYFCCCCFFAALRRFSVGMGYSWFVGLSATLAPRLDSCSHRFPSFFLFFLSSFGFFLFFFLLFSVSFLGFLCYTCMFCSAHIDQQAKKRFIECFLFILAAANFWLDSRTLVSLVWIWHHLGCCLWYQLPFFFTGMLVLLHILLPPFTWWELDHPSNQPLPRVREPDACICAVCEWLQRIFIEWRRLFLVHVHVHVLKEFQKHIGMRTSQSNGAFYSTKFTRYGMFFLFLLSLYRAYTLWFDCVCVYCVCIFPWAEEWSLRMI